MADGQDHADNESRGSGGSGGSGKDTDYELGVAVVSILVSITASVGFGVYSIVQVWWIAARSLPSVHRPCWPCSSGPAARTD